ncbi:MAG: hypothetical protein PHO56_01510 [Patescibacteria group bacterium]|nr:hypothetical protein [Patescibacteria group bacterium]
MDYQVNWQRKFISWTRNKKIFYPVLIAAALLLILAGLWFFFYQPRLEAKRAAELQKQKAAQVLLEKKKNATYVRASFFLSAPVGARGAMNMPSYLEGYWRMADTLNTDKKMTIQYVKNPDSPEPLMYVRYDNKTDFRLAAGEAELKTDSSKYSYAYYFYPVDLYPGADKADFTSMQDDFKEALKSFGIF